MSKYFVFISVFFVFTTITRAQNCNCIPLGPFTIADTSDYAVIFQCDINTVEVKGGVGKASVTIHELYKGKVDRQIQLQFMSTDTCAIAIAPGERWLIYGEYYQVKTILLNACSRSRKYFRDPKADFYAINTGQSFDEEVEALKLVLSSKIIQEPQLSGRELIKPKGTSIIFLIGFSLVGFLLILFILKRFLK
jgi:hypothetical protein